MGEQDVNGSNAPASGLRILKPSDIVAIDEALLKAGRDAQVRLVIEDGRLVEIRTLPAGAVGEPVEAQPGGASETVVREHGKSAISSRSAAKRRGRTGKSRKV